MAEEPDNLVRVMLQRIDERTEHMAFDLHDLKTGLVGLKNGLA